ncbi:MAG TPA: peptidogalycan biosysnthesis protein [Chitinophagaceae bacterium]|nr:peptidogalycan biosysnthesis protein [Chitinophagaceae bacterium]
MQINYSVYKSVNDFPFDWNQQTQQANICAGIEIVEKAKIPNLENYYVIRYHDDKPVYASYFQLLHVTPIHFNLGNKRIQQIALSTALRIVKPTLLVAGNLFRHDVLFFQFLNADLSDDEKAQYYQETTNYMINYTNASGIFLKDVEKNIAARVQKDTTYIQMQDDVSMEIEIPTHWHSFEDYEHELKHKYMQRSRKIRKAFHDVRIESFDESAIEKYSKEMEQLYLQVSQKQLVSMGVINDAFFKELKRILKDKYIVCGYFYQDKLIAFSSAIKHADEYDMNYIGIDYAYNQSHQLYFNILFHCLENAMATQSKKLILGRTAPEAKAILGCEPDYRFSFYKLRNVIVNWFYQMVASYFHEQQGDAWKDRHPFKSSYYQAKKNLHD